MDDDLAPHTDEVGIFIDAKGVFRVVVPLSWSNKSLPAFAYVVIAALLRLSRRDEIEFFKGVERWANEDAELGKRNKRIGGQISRGGKHK